MSSKYKMSGWDVQKWHLDISVLSQNQQERFWTVPGSRWCLCTMEFSGSCRAMGTRRWLPVRGMARRTSSTTIAPWPDSKQMRMSVPSVQVGSLTAKPSLTAFSPQSYYSHLGDPESFVCLQWGIISLCAYCRRPSWSFLWWHLGNVREGNAEVCLWWLWFFFLSFLKVPQWSLVFPTAFLICRLLSCSEVEIRSPMEWAWALALLSPFSQTCKKQLANPQASCSFRDSCLDCLKGTLYTQAHILCPGACWFLLTALVPHHEMSIICFLFPFGSSQISTLLLSAGLYACKEGSNSPCLVYVSFSQKIYIYWDVQLERMESTNLLKILDCDPEFGSLLQQLGIGECRKSGGCTEKREERLLADDAGLLGTRVAGISWGRGFHCAWWECQQLFFSLFLRQKRCFCCQKPDSQNTLFPWEIPSQWPLTGSCWNRFFCPLQWHPGSLVTSNIKADIFNASTSSSAAGIWHLMKMIILSLSCQNFKTGKGLQAVKGCSWL